MSKTERNMKNMKNTKYAICLLPFIGLVIGVLQGGWSAVCSACGFGQVCFALAGTVIPVIMTGGVYLERFMKTIDILYINSNGKKADGSKNITTQTSGFSVIWVICFLMLYGAGLTQIWKGDQMILLGLSYVISRTLHSMSFAWFTAAKQENPRYSFTSAAHKKTVQVMLVTFLAIEFITAVLIQPVIGALMALAAMWVWTYYYYMSKKRFGGITEELAGYFLCLCELADVLVVGTIGRVM